LPVNEFFTCSAVDLLLAFVLIWIRSSGQTSSATLGYFGRGPAMKYNRWLQQPNSLGLVYTDAK